MRYTPRRSPPEIIDFEEDRPYWREVRRRSALRRHIASVQALPRPIQAIVWLAWALFVVLSLFVGWIVVGGASKSFAAELPTFDSAKYCELSTALLASNQQARNFVIKGCMDQEKVSESQIRKSQPILWEPMTSECATMSRAAFGGSYQSFAGCVKVQIGEAVLAGGATFARKR